LDFFIAHSNARPALRYQKVNYGHCWKVYLAELREIEPDAFPDTPANYLANWRDEQHGFIRRSYMDGQQEAVFELASGTEKSFLWLQSLRAVEFVGTKSRGWPAFSAA
jgi:hypothetical protein